MPIKAHLRSLVRFWRVQPQLAIAALFFFSSVFILAAVSIWTWADKTAPAGILGDYDEARIQSTVLGIEGPAAEERGPLLVAQTRCINSSSVIQVEVSVGFRRIDDTPKQVSFLDRVIQSRAPGCNFTITTYPLPPEVTPGLWRVEGISRAISTSELRYWASEPFKVVPARQ